MPWTNTNTQTGFPLSVIIVFIRHIVQVWVHGDSQHPLLLQLRVLTDLLLTETMTQHNYLMLIEKSAGYVSSAFLKSWEINFEAREVLKATTQKKAGRWEKTKQNTGCCAFSPCGHLLLQMLSPHWVQLKKDTSTQKKNTMWILALRDRQTTGKFVSTEDILRLK